MPVYKWSTPYEWLQDYLQEHPEQAFQIALELAENIGPDTLQDLFQSDMEKDGYFEPLAFRKESRSTP